MLKLQYHVILLKKQTALDLFL